MHRDNTVVPETSNTSDSLTNTTEGLTTEPESEQTTEPATKKEKNPVEILVNTQNPLADDWKVDLVNLVNGHQIDRRAYDSLQKMMDDARAQGWNPLICSSYRTMEKQTQLFNNKIQQYKNQTVRLIMLLQIGLQFRAQVSIRPGWLLILLLLKIRCLITAS